MAMKLHDVPQPAPRRMTGEGLAVDPGEAVVPFRAADEPDSPAEIPSEPSAPPPAFEPEPVLHASGIGWQLMEAAPRDRPIWITADPDSGAETLAYWRRSRIKINGVKGWHLREYWASVLTNRAIDFDPFCWRESNTALANRLAEGEAA